MIAPKRSFDISWIAQNASQSAQQQQIPAEDPASDPDATLQTPSSGSVNRPILPALWKLDDVELKVLKTLTAQSPATPQRVLNIAQAAGLDFKTALSVVLNLVSKDCLRIVLRDETAGDHLVEVTDRGRGVP
jgi:predicted transcriptional regulator